MARHHHLATVAEGEDGAPVGRLVLHDVTERKQREAVQTFLAQTAAGTTAGPFFDLLARYQAESLGMDYVCIDRLEGDGLTARTLSV